VKVFYLVCLATTACGTEPTTTTSVPLVTRQRIGEQPMWNIADKLSSYAGYYCEEGKLIALLSNSTVPGDEDTLRQAVPTAVINSCIRHHQDSPDLGELVVLQTNYTFSTLITWRDLISPLFLELGHAVSIGVDYKKNKLVLTSDATIDGEIQDLMINHQIPVDGFETQIENQFRDSTACPNPSSPGTVGDCYRPAIPGGVAIHTTQNGGTGNVLGCTMGPTAYRWDGSAWYAGWVTNSHCVGDWGNQSEWVYQPNTTSPSENLVGFEYIDPPGYTCGSRTCRHSDAAWIWSLYVPPDEGTIVMPVGWTPPGSVNVYPATSRFVVDTWTWSTQGQEVEKVGYASGWTTGIVSAVCSDSNVTSPVTGQQQTKLCNDRASYPSYPGDSGSPVFSWGYNGNHVTILGINWGQNNYTGIYSQWAWVINDLGYDFWITP
jgi:hypothetical protein